MDLKFFPFFNSDDGRELLDEARKIGLDELMEMKNIPDKKTYVATEIFILSMYGNPKYDNEVEHLQKLRDNFLEANGVK